MVLLSSCRFAGIYIGLAVVFERGAVGHVVLRRGGLLDGGDDELASLLKSLHDYYSDIFVTFALSRKAKRLFLYLTETHQII